MTKLTNYEKHFKSKMKDKGFKKAFEKEKHRLEIAYKISQMRTKEHLSQEQLAKKVDTTQSVIARIEAGQQNFTTDTLQKIASAFNRNLKIDFVK
ncbi:helix-turn-helix domain-containing protein [Patescibacteria group bacterium]|nr:helix-turn-helix domain-containing protein [Patescibacteria group bacterium]